MKCQCVTLLDGVLVYVPVYKILPLARLGHPELPTSEETNNYIISQIGNEIAHVIKESVHGTINHATARTTVKKALNAIGYWPNARLTGVKGDSRADAWIDGMINTSVHSAYRSRSWA